MKFYFTLISLFILSTLWIIYLTFSPKKSEVGLTRFLSIEQIHTVKAAERIRLGGLVKSGSIKISRTNQLECVFEINQGEESILVNFNGTRPDLFKDEAEVIVEGNYINGVFVADQLQTKCASRYEGELKEDSSYKPQST